MAENDNVHADITRIAKLKRLADDGLIDAQASYFSHLLDVYGDLGQMSYSRTFTDRERERVDLFQESFAN